MAVAEELHFRRAAERLNMSQPPLTVQIKELERELGVGLFERTRQGVRITEAGQTLLVDARRVLEEVASATRRARAAASGELGEIRLALTQSAEFLGFLPETIQRLRATYSGLVVSLRQMTTAEQVDAVAEHRLHLGVSRKPTGKLPRQVELIPLVADPLMLVVHADDELAGHASVAMRALRDRRFVLGPGDAHSGLREAVLELARGARFFPRVAQEVRQITSTIGMVAAGVGIAILPASARCIHIGQVAFVPIEDAGARSWLHLIRHADAQGRVLGELSRMLLEAAV